MQRLAARTSPKDLCGDDGKEFIRLQLAFFWYPAGTEDMTVGSESGERVLLAFSGGAGLLVVLKLTLVKTVSDGSVSNSRVPR